MNHNQDLAFKSIKIISNTDSYSKNSGSLIVNGGIGCKKTITAEKIVADKLCANVIELDKFVGTISFEVLHAFNFSADFAEITSLFVDELKYNTILPKDENSKIGLKDNKIIEINSKNIYSEKIDIELGNFKDIEVDTIKSKVSIPETLKHKTIVPYDLTSSIGLKDNKIPKIYVESIFSDIINSEGGYFKNINIDDGEIEKISIDNCKTKLLTAEIAKLKNINSCCGDIEVCKVDFLMPKNCGSSIGDSQYKFDINADNLLSENIFNNCKIESNFIKTNQIKPMNDQSSVGELNNRFNIFSNNLDSKKIKSINLDASNIESENMNINECKILNLNVNKILPTEYNSKIGNSTKRFEVNSNKINTFTIESNQTYSKNLDISEDIKLSRTRDDYIIKTESDDSKLQIKCDYVNFNNDFISLNCNNDRINISDDGVEYDELKIVKYHLINDTINNVIYPVKSTIIIDLKIDYIFSYELSKKRLHSDCESIKDGTLIKIYNFGKCDVIVTNIVIKSYKSYEFLFYDEKWRCLNYISEPNSTSKQHVDICDTKKTSVLNCEDSRQLSLGNIFNS